MSNVGPKKVRLAQLLLDPNNFRFRDQDRWDELDEADLGQPAAQRKAHSLICGQNQDGISDLVGSLRANGWLSVDQVLVRPYDDDLFVVVEGNRRIAALRHLEQEYGDRGEPLGALSPNVFEEVPVVVQSRANRVEHLVHMGLVHITGKQQWSQYAQSLAIRELREHHNLSEREVTDRLSVSLQEVRLTTRALVLCDAYRQSDWGDQFNNERYTLLRETARNRALRDWLDWDDDELTAGNERHLQRIFMLMSTIEEVADSPIEDDDDDPIVIEREPALRTRDHVRRLGKLVAAGDSRAQENLERSRDLNAAEQSSDALGRDRVRNAVALIDDQANQLFAHLAFVDNVHAGQLRKAVQKLSGLWVASGRPVDELVAAIGAAQPPSDGALETMPTAPPDFPPGDDRMLRSIFIRRYRGIVDMDLSGLRRINILAGLNAAGKTTILEAVRLLVSQAEPSALLDLLRRRARMWAPDMEWIAENIPHAHIEGSSVSPTSVEVSSNVEHALETTHPGYLRTIVIDASFGGSRQESTSHIYAKSPGRTTTRTGRLQIGPVVHSSPFSGQDPSILARLHDDAVACGLDREVVSLLRENFDANIEDVKLVAGPPPRFRVSRKASPPPDGMDIAMYGDGLQRIFHIGLLFAHASQGFVLIDELENGIHVGLLPSLARMVHSFAERFKAQVFVATHSKECIDAFVGLDRVAEDVRGFSLGFEDSRRFAVGVDGEELARLVQLIDADLRSFR
jgi:AAA domain, putative AbiEii toxin, Type IV TA system